MSDIDDDISDMNFNETDDVDDVDDIDDDMDQKDSDSENDEEDLSEDEDDDEDDEDIDDLDVKKLADIDESEMTQSSYSIAGTKMLSSLYAQILNRYEKTAIIGLRGQQIASGAEIYVETFKGDTPTIIAERELLYKKIPYYIERKMPNGKIIIVKLDELIDVY